MALLDCVDLGSVDRLVELAAASNLGSRQTCFALGLLVCRHPSRFDRAVRRVDAFHPELSPEWLVQVLAWTAGRTDGDPALAFDRLVSFDWATTTAGRAAPDAARVAASKRMSEVAVDLASLHWPNAVQAVTAVEDPFWQARTAGRMVAILADTEMDDLGGELGRLIGLANLDGEGRKRFLDAALDSLAGRATLPPGLAHVLGAAVADLPADDAARLIPQLVAWLLPEVRSTVLDIARLVDGALRRR